ncbi:MAG TPA: error-prone DNA polymerase [Solirubrobacterales bacterium]|nr:error-prone DNA polymerase [Solirubrobacterales bacterium]
MYVELHVHSSYSFGDGASLPEELAIRAAEYGYPAFALTDHDNVCGAMEFAQACAPLGIRPIVGAELTLVDPEARPERFHLTLLVENADGWANLCRLLTEAHADTRPHPERDPLPPVLALASLLERNEGLVCLSGCARHGALAGAWERGEPRRAELVARRLVAAFGPERLRIELQRPYWRRDRARNRWLAALAERFGVTCVATGNVHAHDPSRAPLADALVAVRNGTTLEESEALRRGNASCVLAPPAEMAARFAECPEAVAESARLAERLQFDLTSELGYRYPGSEDPDADATLAEICRGRLELRYAGMPERPEAERRLEEELRVIRGLGLSGFFLLHFDLLELARDVAAEVRGPDSARALLPPGRGRGSSVSSVVCYLTGLSHVDPVRAGLFLGRFLNDEITEMPDIDLDFPRDIRERLIPRVHERYGRDRAALVSAFACYRSRGAVRDLGKALGLPPAEIERVAGIADVYARGDELERDIAEAIGPGRAQSPRWRWLARLAREAWGLPRHVSQHPGGMVLSTRPLVDICPVQPAAMEGRQIVQWDKDSCADAGFLKIDLLGLGMLSAVERCVESIAKARDERIDLSRIPLDDTETFEAIRAAETTGVFQIESRAQMQMLPRSLPETLDDVVVQVALVRPGPIQGGAVHPYLARRKQLREDPEFEIPYEHPSLEPILSDTLGAIVFQDQVIQVAMALAGFTAGEAEGLRRAMSRKRSEAALDAYGKRFVAGAVERGVERELAEHVFEQVRGFSGFGFPKSHAAAFGLLAYQSTWLRVHYGPELLCALFNEQPMGFYPPDSLAHEAQRRGIDVCPADVNRSGVECTVELRPGAEPAVRLGIGYVKGIAAEEARALVEERQSGGRYRDLADLASRSGVGRDGLERLAWAGACEPLGIEHGRAPRREELWRLGIARGSDRRGTVVRGEGGRRRRGPEHVQLALPLPLPALPDLRPLDPWERIVADYASTGVTLSEHPMELVRPRIDRELVLTRELPMTRDGSRVAVAGLVVARQRPATANGVVFMLLEDEGGVVNVIVPPSVYERCRLAVRTAPFALVEGTLERREGVTNLLASAVERLETPSATEAEVRHIEPPTNRELGRDTGDAYAAERAGRVPEGELAAVAPRAHSFGRRG